jgi:putative nucleotidyltransferase with HDIG domain
MRAWKGDLNTQSAAAAEANHWAVRAPAVPASWFVWPSALHGVRHTQRVHLHAQRLAQQLGWTEADTQLVLCAALWHDIGRTGDGWSLDHGERSAERVVELALPKTLAIVDLEVVLFAIGNHSLPDDVGEKRAARLADPERALRVLWLLKDADGLDRVRLGEPPDPTQLRSATAAASIDLAWALLAAVH